MKIFNKKFRINLLTQIILLISIVVSTSMFVGSTLFSILLDDILTGYIGQQAMIVAKLTANNERIVQAFDDENPSTVIQPITETIRKMTGASYVVIGNRDGIRYSHNNPENIGQPMGSSNDPVFLEKKSVLYQGVGISGPAIKAKTPIVNSNGDIIGVSSVGFLIDDIETKKAENIMKIAQSSILLFIIGIAGAVFMARRIKKLIFGLEPEQISFLFKEKEAILESIRDAIVATDMQGHVVSMNKRARELLNEEDVTVGEKISSPRLLEMLREVLQTTQGQINQKILLGSHVYVIDSSPIIQDQHAQGVVFTFRPESEIEQLADEFTKIKSFSENMRALNHEYLNKLNTIYGLIQLKQHDKAIEIISDEVKERQDIIAFLISSVKDPLVAACLLGKVNRAKELKVTLEIDRESNLVTIPETADSKALVTILGNVIDNAMEAARESKGQAAVIKVSFTDLGRDIIFEIEDNGIGIPKEKEMVIFENGFTTKNGENRGLGLAIVKNAIELLDGQIYISKSALGGARFTIVVPKS